MTLERHSNIYNIHVPADKIGEKFIKRLVKGYNESPWYWSLLNLAWTAGPVTFLALQGGYYLGYGKSAAPELFIYFAGYTIIAGILAVIAQFIRFTVIAPKIEADDKTLLHVVDRLFLFYFSVRNTYLKSYPEDEQPVIAAWWSCRSAATDVDILEEAIRDATGDDDLAHAIKRIEFYRRQGYTDLMQNEYAAHRKQVSILLEEIADKFPSLAEQIQQRFEGRPPSLRYGQPRPLGFVERLMSADEKDQLTLATPDDVLAIITFTIEMLLGRVVIALYPTFNGHRNLEDAREKFDALLSDFRLLLRKRNSRIGALIVDINQSNKSEMLQPRGANSEQLKALLLQVLQQQPSDKAGYKRYQDILAFDERLQRLWRKLRDCEQAYNKLWLKEGERLKRDFSTTDSPEKSDSVLAIEEHEITLTRKQKITLASNIQQLLDHIVIRKSSLLGLTEADDGLTPLDMEDYKHIAVELLNLLDELLNITEPEEQLAVEASREADFGCIEPGLAAQTKLGWGQTMVEEVQLDRIQITHHLAAYLVRYLNVPLGRATMDYLAENYGASRDYLEQLQVQESAHVELATDILQKEILHLPKWHEITQQKIA